MLAASVALGLICAVFVPVDATARQQAPDVVASAPVSFDPDPGRAVEPIGPAPDDAAARDSWYRGLAELTGSTVEEAQVRTQLQGEAGLLQVNLAEAYPETFGGLWITSVPPFEIRVAFTDIPSAAELEAAMSLSGFTHRSVLRPQNVKYALEFLIEIYDAVEATLPLQDPALAREDLGVSVDVIENVVEVRHPNPSAESLIRTAGPDDAIRFVVGEGGTEDAVSARGGQRTDVSCTTGFVIRKNSSIEAGNTTAAHGVCKNSSELHPASVPKFSTIRYEDGTDTDVAWLSLADRDWTPTNTIVWNDSGNVLTVRGRVGYTSISVGDYLCKYGWKTGNTCGLVERTVCCSSGDRFVQVDAPMLSDGGDSGGPVYQLVEPHFHAVGIHKGGDGTNDPIFSAISFFESDWGVKVATSGIPTPRFEWFVKNTNGNGIADDEWEWAESGSTPVTGTWRSGATDRPGFFKNGVWDLEGEARQTYGTSSDRPVPGDWNGNGIDDLGYFRPATATFFREGSFSLVFGNPWDVGISGDWDGDGDDDIGVWRPSEAKFYLRNGNGTVTSFYYGDFGDLPLVGDWDDDGTDEVGVYRPSTSWWYLQGLAGFEYGNPHDVPLPGDWNGDGRDTVGVVRD